MWFLFREVSSSSGCLWVLGMGCLILLWHSLSLPYNYLSCENVSSGVSDQVRQQTGYPASDTNYHNDPKFSDRQESSEPRYEKTGLLHMRKQRRRSASR